MVGFNIKRMKNIIIISLLLISSHLFSQSGKVFLVDENKNDVSNFEVLIFTKDSVIINKSISNNYFKLNNKLKDIDSITVKFNFFFNQKINLKDLKVNDTVFLNSTISLKEVVIKGSKKTFIGTFNGSKRKLTTLGTSKSLIRLDVSEYIEASINSVNIYLFKNFSRDNKRYSSKNKTLQIHLFQSSLSPNDSIIDLLKKPLIVNTEELKTGWLKVDLKKMNLEIQDLKYLFLGYSCINEELGVGTVKAEKNENIENYIGTESNGWTNEFYFRSENYRIPAIRVELEL